MVDEALKKLSLVFSQMYSLIGRPLIPPEQLLKTLLLQALYTIRNYQEQPPACGTDKLTHSVPLAYRIVP